MFGDLWGLVGIRVCIRQVFDIRVSCSVCDMLWSRYLVSGGIMVKAAFNARIYIIIDIIQ
jgi:hypothetical protein